MDVRAIALSALALLVIGAGFGRNSVEPVVVQEAPTKTITKEVEVPGPTETVYVNTFPDVCLEAAELTSDTYHRTMGALGLITPMTDALALGRAGIAGQNSAWITDADNKLRQLQSQALNFMPQEDLGGDPLRQAINDCKKELNQ